MAQTDGSGLTCCPQQKGNTGHVGDTGDCSSVHLGGEPSRLAAQQALGFLSERWCESRLAGSSVDVFSWPSLGKSSAVARLATRRHLLRFFLGHATRGILQIRGNVLVVLPSISWVVEMNGRHALTAVLRSYYLAGFDWGDHDRTS